MAVVVEKFMIVKWALQVVDQWIVGVKLYDKETYAVLSSAQIRQYRFHAIIRQMYASGVC